MSDVVQTGSVTPGHAVAWTTTGVVRDAGTAGNGSLTGLGLQTASGLAVTVQTGPVTGSYAMLGLGFSPTNGNAQISVNSYNGAAVVTLEFNINGNIYPFTGGSSGGNMLGPVGAISGDLLKFNGTSGMIVSDSGILASNLVTTAGGGTISAAMLPVAQSGSVVAAFGLLAINGGTVGARLTIAAGGISVVGTSALGPVAVSGTLSANSTVVSSAGGFRFPDNTTQTTAAVGNAAANPTASIGAAAVNGVAATFMRSDAAPALATTGVGAAIYGASTLIPVITVDATGRITAASSVASSSIVTAGAVGSFGFFVYGGSAAFGASVAGSALTPSSGQGTTSGAAQVGTWRCLGNAYPPVGGCFPAPGGPSLFQRIA